MPRRAEDVVAVLDALHFPRANFFGYSMGEWIGFGMPKYPPERVHALLIGVAHPYVDHSWDAFRQVDGTKPEAFVAAFEAVMAQRIPPELKPSVLANDLQALAAAARSIFASRAGGENIDAWKAIGARGCIFWLPAEEDRDAVLSRLDRWSQLL